MPHQASAPTQKGLGLLVPNQQSNIQAAREKRRLQNRNAQRKHRLQKAAQNSLDLRRQDLQQESSPSCQCEPDVTCPSQIAPLSALSTPSLSPHKTFPAHNISAGLDDRTNFESICLEDPFLEIYGSDQTDVDLLGVHASGFTTEGTLGSSVGSTDGFRTSSLSPGLLPTSILPHQKHPSSGLLPLHIASKFGFTPIIKVLLKNGADLNLADGQGRTALHYAVEGSHIDSIKVLLHWGAKPLMTDFFGLNVLQLAVINDDCNVVALLMDHGVDPNSALLCV
ncbi:hypothetical protein N7527_009334 [Penicillium freii]|nr:hypothetical protein N7527_009334 [Penicillium freii]